MRCKNCGWPNEPSAVRCIKCNAALTGSMTDFGMSGSSEPEAGINSTMRETSGGFGLGSNTDFGGLGGDTCSQCGYPIGAGMTECPVCHTPIGQRTATPTSGPTQAQAPIRPQQQPPRNPASPRGGFRPGGTINPWTTPADDGFCTLRRLSWQNEQVNYEPVSFSGDSIVLNRANTDANNNSITSREQAVIIRENGEWFIENRSDLQTTMIRVDRRHKLEDGDVIVLGNRLFEFRKG